MTNESSNSKISQYHLYTHNVNQHPDTQIYTHTSSYMWGLLISASAQQGWEMLLSVVTTTTFLKKTNHSFSKFPLGGAINVTFTHLNNITAWLKSLISKTLRHLAKTIKFSTNWKIIVFPLRVFKLYPPISTVLNTGHAAWIP